MPSRRTVPLTVAILVAVVIGVIALAFWSQGRQADHASGGPAPDVSEQNAYLYDEPREMRSFNLLDQQGEEVDESMLEGRWTIAFIGFTYCPDICPATMATLSRASRQISSDVPPPQFLFISADPERDTPEQLNRYITFFGDDFRGVTGDYDILKALARDLNAVFVHREDENGEVIVDHSSHLAIISPRGQFVGMIQPPHNADDIARVYHAVVNWNP